MAMPSTSQIRSDAAPAARLRAAWERGERPALDSLLSPEPDRRLAALVALVEAELALRQAAGLDEYLARFPELAAADLAAPRGTAAPGPATGEWLGGDLRRSSTPVLPHPDAAAFGEAPTLHPKGHAAAVALPFPTIPQFLIEWELGRGGMGVVYLARHLHLNRPVALKMLLASQFALPEELLRFRLEGEATARVHHPNVVQTYEVGVHDGRPFLVLEYVAGGSLADRLATGPLPWRDAAALVAEVAHGMHAAHLCGLVHRDLKPGNVLLSAGSAPRSAELPEAPTLEGLAPRAPGAAVPVPKVSDFGLAKWVEAGAALTQTGAIVGTPNYMAPEQAEGRKDVGPLADVWALGAILYECLTGRPPFQGATPMETVFHVLHKEPPPPRQLRAGIPADLETTCLKCLAKEPARRYPSAAALAEDLHRFLNGEPISARPVGPAERAYRWCRRNPTVAALLTLVLLALVGGTVISTYFGLQANARAVDAELARDRAREAEGKAREAEAAAMAAKERSNLEAAKLRFRDAVAKAEAGAVDTGLYGLIAALRLAPTSAEAAPFRRAVCTSFAAWSRQLPILRYTRPMQDDTLVRPIGLDGRYFLSWHPPEPAIQVRATATGEPVPGSWQLPAGEAVIAISPDGTVLLTRTERDGRQFLQLRHSRTGEPLDPGGPWPVEGGNYNTVLVAQGVRLAGTEDGRFWDLHTGRRCPFTWPPGGVRLPPVLGRDGWALAVVYFPTPQRTQKVPRVEFWDVATGQIVPFPLRLPGCRDERITWGPCAAGTPRG
jgi:serine/threonine protein kinase